MFSKNINQKVKTWKLRKGRQSCLCQICGPGLKTIPINEDIPVTEFMECTRMFAKTNQRGQSFLFATCHLDLIHIALRYP